MRSPPISSSTPLAEPLLHNGKSGSGNRSSRSRFHCSWSSLLNVVPAVLALGIFGAMWCGAVAIWFSPMFSPAATPRDDEEKMRGVNLGGWLVLEPWVTPSMLWPFLCVGPCPADETPVIDERSFCDRLGPDEARLRLEILRSTWVTEATFVRIAASGLNTVRVPFGYWIFGDTDLCPQISAIHHLDNAVDWAEKYGLSIVMDLHGVQPSQNGMDHSGTSSHRPFARATGWQRPSFSGSEWLQPDNVVATVSVLRRIVRRYAGRQSVVRIGMVNEPMLMNREWCDEDCPIGVDELLNYYNTTWSSIAEFVSPGQRPVLDVGLGGSLQQWGSVTLPPVLRDALIDVHTYQAWIPYGMWLPQALHLRLAACDAAGGVRAMHAVLGVPVMVGEWSIALTDCAHWVNGVGLASGEANTGFSASCSRVPCPTRFNPLPRGATLDGGPDADGYCSTGLLPTSGGPLGPLTAEVFYALFTEYMMAAAEQSAGWLFWNFDNEMGDPRWSFFAAQARGWFPANLSNGAYQPRIPACEESDGVPLFGDLVTTAVVLVGCAVPLGVGTLVMAVCRCFQRRND